MSSRTICSTGLAAFFLLAVVPAQGRESAVQAVPGIGGLYEASISAGLGYQPNPTGHESGNLPGVGFNWNRPKEDVFVYSILERGTPYSESPSSNPIRRQ